MKLRTLFKNLKKHAVKGIVISALTGLVAAGLFMNSNPAQASDCDDNAVVYCGAATPADLINDFNNGDGVNSATSIHDIYSYFGISASQISNMGTTSVDGTVTKTGDVYIGSELVATNALTAGRQDIAGSTKEDNGTVFYTRPPSVSFTEASLPAMVVLGPSGVFQFAILNSCGNPIKATPQLPAYTITKNVKLASSNGAYSKSVTAQSGTDVDYQVVITSTGAVPVVNVTAQDTLPANETYVSGTLAKDGTTLSDAAATQFFGSGLLVATKLDVTATTTLTFEALVGSTNTSATCTPGTLTNYAYESAPALSTNSSSAAVNMTCPTPTPPPVTTPTGACTELNAVADSTYVYTATANYTTSGGASLSSASFNFGSGSPVAGTVTSSGTVVSPAFTYPTAGTYNIVATLNFTDGVASVTCAKQITITSPAVPCGVCSGLTYVENGTDIYTATAKYTTENGATFKSATFNFGSGSPVTVTTSSNGTVVSPAFTYPGSGTYTIVATLSFNSPSTAIEDQTCSATVTIPPVVVVVPTGYCNTVTLVQDATDIYTATAHYTTTNGATIKSATFNFGTGSPVNGTANGAGIITSPAFTYSTPGTYTVTATLSFNSPSTAIANSNCTAQVTIPKPPVTPAPCATCNYLTAEQDGTNTYIAVANYTANNGATLSTSSFNFGDGSAASSGKGGPGTVESNPHTYTTPGTYTITATLTFTSSSSAQAITVNCSTKVNIPKPPVVPTATGVCTGLTYALNGNTVTATAKYTTTNGATLNTASFNFGTGSPVNGTVTSAGVVQAVYTYATPGTYEILGTLSFNSSTNSVANSSCSASVIIPATPIPPTTPTVLVNTGPGSVIEIFAVTTIAAAVAHQLFARRRYARRNQ